MKGFSFYNAFNLVIRSNFRIPFLINDHKDDRKFDIEFNYDSSLSKPKNSKRTLSSEYAYESSEDLGYFLISNGEKIDFNIKEKADINSLCKFILYSPMADLLFQRGNLVLHGSSIRHNNKTYLFLGISKQGKSSLIYEFLKSDSRMITEDICSISINDGLKITPSFPLLNLEPLRAVANSCIEDEYPINNKRGRNIYKIKNSSFYQNESSIDACYFMHWGERNSIREEKSEIEIFKQVISNAWLPYPFSTSKESEEILMKNLGSYIKNTPFFHYTKCKNFSVRENFEFIRDHLDS